MSDKHKQRGLSKENIGLVTGILFGALLLWGPVNPPGILVRTLYLVGAPLLMWATLTGTRYIWKLGEETNDRINRAIIVLVAGIFILLAFQAFTSKYHQACTQYARNSDGGSECVGDYVTARGKDTIGVLFYSAAAAGALWYAIAKRPD